MRPRAIGTADPIRLVASAANGRWVVACQARVDNDGDGRTRVVVGTDSLEGDNMVPYLFRGGGDGELIDGWIARSPDDRWFVVLRDGVLTLIDDATGTVSVIADSEVPPYRYGLRGLATLDGESKRVAYVRRGTGGRVVVVRDLEQPRERVIELARPVAALVADRQGTWAAVWFAREAPRIGLRTRPPALREAARGETCQSWVGRDVTGGPPDAWLRLDTGARELGTSTLGHVGGATISKTDDGAIRVGTVDLIPASCGAEVTIVSAAPLRLVVACRARAGAPSGVAEHAVTRGSDLSRARHIVAFGNHVIDLAQARVLGVVPGLVQAVDTTGRALVASDVHHPERGELLLGPLHWIAPSSAP